MPGLGLSALLGIGGGANAVGQGLERFGQQYEQREREKQGLALSMLQAGYLPVGVNVTGGRITPTAQDHPLADGLAHTPVDPTAQRPVSVPELSDAPQGESTGGPSAYAPGDALRTVMGAPSSVVPLPAVKPPSSIVPLPAAPTAPTPTPQPAPPATPPNAPPASAPVGSALMPLVTMGGQQWQMNPNSPQAANIAHVRAETEAQQAKAQSNQRNFGALRQLNPSHPAVSGGYDPGTDYASLVKETLAAKLDSTKAERVAQGDYATLKAEFPNDPLSQKPYAAGTNYGEALKAALQQRGLTAAADRQKPKQTLYVDPQGNYHPLNSDLEPPAGWKPATGKSADGGPLALGSQGIFGAGRSIAAVQGMHDADKKMKRFEVPAASGKINYTDWDYMQGRLATAYDDAAKETGALGHIVPFYGTATGAEMLRRLNQSNPALANYLQAASQWALEESSLSNRPSEYRTKMDEFISAIKPGAGKESIHDIWSSRAARLSGYDLSVPAAKRSLERAAQSGKPQAASVSGADPILAKYGLQPQQ